MSHPKEMTVDAREIDGYCGESGFHHLPVRRAHVDSLAKLHEPRELKHRDPFDRMLIAQALTDGMLLLTKDSRIAQYDEPCIFPL